MVTVDSAPDLADKERLLCAESQQLPVIYCNVPFVSPLNLEGAKVEQSK